MTSFCLLRHIHVMISATYNLCHDIFVAWCHQSFYHWSCYIINGRLFPDGKGWLSGIYIQRWSPPDCEVTTVIWLIVSTSKIVNIEKQKIICVEMTNKNHPTDTQIKYYFKKFIFVMKVHINDNVMYTSSSSWRFASTMCKH